MTDLQDKELWIEEKQIELEEQFPDGVDNKKEMRLRMAELEWKLRQSRKMLFG